MRALLLKEYKQNHLLPWGGLMVSAALIALCALWIAVYARTEQDQADMARFVSLLVVIGSGLVVVVIGSGLISSETGTGALTYLLGLPVSRSRIWLAKAIAGVGLAVAAILLLAVPVGLAVPGMASSTGLRVVLYLPDLAAIGLGVFSVTLLCSTLLARTLTVLLVAPVVVVILAVGVVLAIVWDITPLRYDAGVADLSLWTLVLAAPFLFASWVTFTRGELLDSRRRWLLAVPTALAGVIVVCALMVGAARWQQRYVRSEVRAVARDVPAIVSPYSDVAAIHVEGNAAPLERDEQKGWQLSPGTLRSSHTVVVDLRTGRELLVWPGNRAVAFMPDGRRVVAAPAPDPFNLPHPPEVWDMTRGRRLAERAAQTPSADRWEGPGPNYGLKVPWSPDGKWLVYIGGQKLTKNGMPYGQVMMTMRVDRSQQRKVTTWDAKEEPKPKRPGERLPAPDVVVSDVSWAPDDTLYLLTKGGELSRYSPEDGTRTVVWRRSAGPPPMEWMWYQHRLAVAPDGRLIAVRMPEVARSTVYAGKVHTWILGLKGGQVVPVADFTDDRSWQRLIWSWDGSTLYIGPFLRWQEGQASPTVIRLPAGIGTTNMQTTVLPFGDRVLIQEMGKPFVANAQGTVRPLAQVYPKVTVTDRVDGVDTQGRLVVARSEGTTSVLALLDPESGGIENVYP